MGCDIHLHVEVRIGDEWLHLGAPNIERNYDLFERMAGVRGEPENAISPPRGIPDDITKLTRLCMEQWEGDAHSHSWLGVEEIQQLEEWIRANMDSAISMEHGVIRMYLCGNGFTDWYKYPQENPLGVQDIRFVFWFDN